MHSIKKNGQDMVHRSQDISPSIEGRRMTDTTERHQWRFFWPSADVEMIGARWHDGEHPSQEDIDAMAEVGFREWWVETRTITYGPVTRADPLRVYTDEGRIVYDEPKPSGGRCVDAN